MRYSALFALPLVVAISQGRNARLHSEVAKRGEFGVGIYKRFENARFTFYQPGMGACGKQNSASDFIVALNRPQYGNGEDCFKEITITANGKTHGATIVDECEGCPQGALDMSGALFDFFASESAGEIYGTWEFGSGGGGDGSSSSSKTTHSSSSTRKHSSTTHASSSTRKSREHTSTSTSKFGSSTSSATPINYSTGDASGLTQPTGAVGAGTASNLNNLNQVVIDLAALVVTGGNAK